MRRFFLLSVVLLLAGIAGAQDKLQPRVVRVTGVSEIKVVPDRAIIRIGVEKQNVSAQVAKQLTDDAVRQLLAELRNHGIDSKDIQTTRVSLYPQYDYRGGMKLSYFVAGQTLSVTVRDLGRLDTLLEALLKAGTNRIDSVEYETSELRRYRDQARESAVRAAQEKAEALAKALGQTIGRAYSIEEVPEPTHPWFGGLAGNTTAEAARVGSSAGPATAPGELKVSATVNVAFDLN